MHVTTIQDEVESPVMNDTFPTFDNHNYASEQYEQQVYKHYHSFRPPIRYEGFNTHSEVLIPVACTGDIDMELGIILCKVF